MTTPFALLDDVFIKGKSFEALYYCGACVIVLGFLITNWQHHTEKELGLLNKNTITRSGKKDASIV